MAVLCPYDTIAALDLEGDVIYWIGGDNQTTCEYEITVAVAEIELEPEPHNCPGCTVPTINIVKD